MARRSIETYPRTIQIIWLRLVAVAGALCCILVFTTLGWLLANLIGVIVLSPLTLAGRDPHWTVFAYPSLLQLLVGTVMVLVVVSAVAILEGRKRQRYTRNRTAADRVRDNAMPNPEDVGDRVARRKVVICIDGTNDFAATVPTHVYRLYGNLPPDSAAQISYYDGGVGTLADTTRLSGFGRTFATVWDLAFGLSLRRNVLSAYQFLMDNYRGPKLDEVYLFGFSRGAYACRVLAALLYVYGVLPRTYLHLAPFVWQSFDGLSTKWDWKAIRLMKSSMHIHRVEIEYMGLWDTVSSIGFLRQRTYPYTSSLPNVCAGRHAISIDERRNMFTEQTVEPDSRIEEVWFSGNHRGVGGGAVESKQLSCFAYNFVVDPVREHLRVEGDRIGFERASGADPKPPIPFAASIEEPPTNEWKAVASYILAGFIPQRIFTAIPESRRDPNLFENGEYRGPTGEYNWHWFRFWHDRRPHQAKVHSTFFDRQRLFGDRYPGENVDPETNMSWPT